MPKKLTAEQAIQRLTAFTQKKPEGSDWREISRVTDHLPEGVPEALTTTVLVELIDGLGVGYITQTPAHARGAVLAALRKCPRRPDAVFALSGLEFSSKPEDMGPWLSGMALTSASHYRAGGLEKALATPGVVAAAQAALAVTPQNEWRTSHHLPVLAADASAESLDILTPYALALLERRDSELDWFRKCVVPLLGAGQASEALKKQLEGAVEERTESSPARAFCRAIGMNPPPAKLVFNASFFAAEPASTAFPHAWQVKADSTKSAWFSARRNEKWQWSPCDPLKDLKSTLGPGLVRVTFRASGKDVDREKLQAWLESFLSS